jgi:hypothetical protein
MFCRSRERSAAAAAVHDSGFPWAGSADLAHPYELVHADFQLAARSRESNPLGAVGGVNVRDETAFPLANSLPVELELDLLFPNGYIFEPVVIVAGNRRVIPVSHEHLLPSQIHDRCRSARRELYFFAPRAD